MTLTLDLEQAQVLREILEGTLVQLHIESAMTDRADLRDLLHGRERLVETTLAQLSDAALRWSS